MIFPENSKFKVSTSYKKVDEQSQLMNFFSDRNASYEVKILSGPCSNKDETKEAGKEFEQDSSCSWMYTEFQLNRL